MGSKLQSIFVIVIMIYSGLLINIPFNPIIHPANAASTWIQTSDSDFNNGTLSNVTVVGIGEDAELRLKSIKYEEWVKKLDSITPYGRPRHALASIYGIDKVLLFGGDAQDKDYSNDTWVYTLSDNNWIEKTPSTIPTERQEHAMATIYGTDKVMLFGGEIKDWEGSGDTWIYDLSDNTWTKKTPMSKPSPRYKHAMATIWGTDKVVLFGGYYWDESSWKNIYYDDTWVYDLSEDTWANMNLSGNKPSTTENHAMASIYGDDKVVLFGGSFYNGNWVYCNETWVYDLSNNNWTNMNPSGNKPSSRNNHAIASVDWTDKAVLFGGNNGSDETWVYDLSDNNWTNKTPLSKPSPRTNHTMASIYGTDKVVLFSGDFYLHDTWVFDLSVHVKTGTFVSHPYDIGPKSSFKIINWSANTSTNTNIKFQLRTAATESGLSSKDFVGSDGNILTYYMFPPSNIWSGHNGERWIQYKVYFNTANKNETPKLKNVTISYNCWPDTILFSPTNGSITITNKPTFVWNFTDQDSKQQTAFQVLIDDDSKFESVDYNSGEQNSPNQQWQFPSGTSYTIIHDGMWYWKVRTKDNDGDWGIYSPPWEITIDSGAPSSALIIPIQGGFYNSLNNISGIASDPPNGTEVIKVEIIIKRLSDDHYWDGSDWGAVESWVLTTGTTIWKYDSSTVTWTSGSQYSVQSRAADNATNIELPSIGNIFTIDTDRPLSTIDIPIDNTYLNNLDTISGSSIDVGGSGINIIEISIKQTSNNSYWAGDRWVSSETWLLASGTTMWSYDASSITWTSNTQYCVLSRATDNAFNIEIPGNGNMFIFDTDKPLSRVDVPINNTYLNDLNNISGVAIDTGGSGIDEVEITIMQYSTNVYWNGIDWDLDESWLTATGTNVWTYNASDVPWVTDTYYIIRSRSADKVGNTEIPGTGITIMYDNKPPDLLISINNDDEYTSSTTVILSLQSEDSGSGTSQMEFSTDGILWSGWETFDITRSFDLSANDGEKIVYFKARDRAGNTAKPVFDSIILDTSPPHSLSILINDGESEANSASVTLKLNAIDDLSGVYQMAFSTDEKNWTSWEHFIYEKNFTLSPVDGEKIIYFKVKDKAGNIADQVFATIILNTTSSLSENSTPEKSSFNMGFWITLIIIIILIIVLIIVGLLIKRKKRIEQKKSPPTAAVTINPGGLSAPAPVISMGQAPAAAQPPTTTGTGDSNIQPPSTSTAPLPILASSTTTTQVPTPQQIPQVVKLPQLPPPSTKMDVRNQPSQSSAPPVQPVKRNYD